MKIILAAVIAICTLSMIQSPNPPTNIVVFESTICGRCRSFNKNDIGYILTRTNYSRVVNISLNPSIHLEKKQVNGQTVYEHRFGETYTNLAFAQLCINNHYDNDRALNWASKTSYTSKSLEYELKQYFKEDGGQKVLNCIKSPDVQKYAETALNQYYQSGLWGMLPIIRVNEERKIYFWQNMSFLESICRQRTDRAELAACTGIKMENSEILDEVCYVSQNDSNQGFDYEAFWNSPDDY